MLLMRVSVDYLFILKAGNAIFKEETKNKYTLFSN